MMANSPEGISEFEHNYPLQYINEGHLNAKVILLDQKSDTLYYQLLTGPKYKIRKVGIGNMPVEYYERLKAGKYSGAPFSKIRLHKLSKEIINYSENIGYPFSEVYFDSVKIDNYGIDVNINYSPGPYIKYGSIITVNDSTYSTKFLHAFLQIKKGEGYNQRQLNGLERSIGQLPAIALNEGPIYEFQYDTLTIKLDLSRRKSNKFNGIVGLLPSQSEERNMVLTGNVLLHLNNLFRSGKELYLYWKRNEVLSQQLRINYMHPNIFYSPYGVDMGLELFRQDSSFLTRDIQLCAFYRMSKSGQFELRSIFSSSSHINTPQSDTIADFNVKYYGFGYNVNRTDDFFNPGSGYTINTFLYVGDKVYQNNNSENKSVQYKFGLKASYYLPISSLRSTFLIGGNVGILFSDFVLSNELFRLGGMNNIRGFSENQFYAKDYSYLTQEWRLKVDNLSYMFLFVDAGAINISMGMKKINWPIGLGIGATIGSKNSFLKIAYANGFDRGNSINLSNSKFHFGYEGIF